MQGKPGGLARGKTSKKEGAGTRLSGSPELWRRPRRTRGHEDHRHPNRQRHPLRGRQPGSLPGGWDALGLGCRGASHQPCLRSGQRPLGLLAHADRVLGLVGVRTGCLVRGHVNASAKALPSRRWGFRLLWLNSGELRAVVGVSPSADGSSLHHPLGEHGSNDLAVRRELNRRSREDGDELTVCLGCPVWTVGLLWGAGPRAGVETAQAWRGAPRMGLATQLMETPGWNGCESVKWVVWRIFWLNSGRG